VYSLDEGIGAVSRGQLTVRGDQMLELVPLLWLAIVNAWNKLRNGVSLQTAATDGSDAPVVCGERGLWRGRGTGGGGGPTRKIR
jgi:hypothetical protein